MAVQLKTRIRRWLGPGLSLVLFGMAVWLIHSQLEAYRLKDILQSLSDVPPQRLWGATVLTIIAYGLMTGYDALALRYIHHPLAYAHSALASFIGYAFSNNIGLSMIAGASIRYRLYSAWGLSILEISQVVFFCTASLWLGFFALFGTVSVWEPLTVPLAVHLPFHSTLWLGLACLAVVALYSLLAGLWRKTFVWRGQNINWPGLSLVPWQVGLGAADWALAAAVLYVLIDKAADVSYPQVLAVFLLAQFAGLASQVPGGLGVFESVFTLLLSPGVPPPQTLGALLAFRLIYYWLPLALATLMLGLQEIFRGQDRFKALGTFFGRWVSPLVPQVFGLAVFLSGTILLLSGATPALSQRTALLEKWLPLSFLEISHFSASLIGMGLLILGRGLQRRLNAAYGLTLALMGLGIATSLIKGFDYEEAAVLLLVGLALLPCRRYFYRRSSLIESRFNLSWFTAVLIVLSGSIWLGFYSFRHVEYADSLWWQFAFNGHASRFLRASLGALVVLLFFAGARLIRPAPPKPSATSPRELDQAWEVVRRWPDTTANLALLGDKYFLFDESGQAFIMYGVEGRSWVAMGDPVGPEESWPELLWRFRELADRYGGRSVFYEVDQRYLHHYLDMGLTLIKLGEEARVLLTDFDLEGSRNKAFRNTIHRLDRSGCRFQIAEPTQDSADLMAEMREVSQAWLAEKNSREKGFSLGFFREDYLRRYPLALVRLGEELTAFANLWPGADRQELSLDLMRYHPQAPNGIMDYLFLQIMLWGKEQGYQWFNLGMTPLAGLEERGLAPIWSKLGAFVFRHGEQFYNFKGLRQYKDKFNPVWSPKYLACPGGISLPRTVADISILVSGGLTGVFAK